MATPQTAMGTDAQVTWSDSASCDGVDTRAYVGARVAGLVGRVRHRALTDERPHASDLLIDALSEIDASCDPVAGLVTSITSVHEALRHDGIHDGTLDEVDACGSATITAIVRNDDVVSVVHVGDASVVRVRHGEVAELTPLNRAHTLAAEMLAAGRQPNARANAVLTRVVGGDDPLAIDVTRIKVEPGTVSLVVMGSPVVDLRELVRRLGLAADATTTLAITKDLLPGGTAALVLTLDGALGATNGTQSWERAGGLEVGRGVTNVD